MKQQLTYSDLRGLDADIRKMQSSPALSLFLRKYIVAFYNKNMTRLDVMYKTVTTNITKYVQHVEGKPVTKKDDKGVEVYVFNDAKAEAVYVKEMESFWNLSFEIEV